MARYLYVLLTLLLTVTGCTGTDETDGPRDLGFCLAEEDEACLGLDIRVRGVSGGWGDENDVVVVVDGSGDADLALRLTDGIFTGFPIAAGSYDLEAWIQPCRARSCGGLHRMDEVPVKPAETCGIIDGMQLDAGTSRRIKIVFERGQECPPGPTRG